MYSLRYMYTVCKQRYYMYAQADFADGRCDKHWYHELAQITNVRKQVLEINGVINLTQNSAI